MRAVLWGLPMLGRAALLTLAILTGAQAAPRTDVFDPAAAMPGRRVALVIGINHYAQAGAALAAPDLANPISDAGAIRDTLRKLGFAVIYGEDLGKSDFEAALDSFQDRIRDADIALVYFSGHGATFDDLPYLVPADATFVEKRRTMRQLVKVEDVLGRLRDARGVRIALFDACRDNLAEQALKQAVEGSKGVVQTRGLARVPSADGLIVMYAAQHLQTAEDGTGGHSPFATALLQQLPSPGINVTTMLEEVARRVIELTAQKQKPELVVSLFDKFTLVDGGAGSAPAAGEAEPAATVDPRVAEAALVWPALAGSTDLAALSAFRQRYAGTVFEVMAQSRIAALTPVQAEAPRKQKPAGPLHFVSIPERSTSRSVLDLIGRDPALAGDNPAEAEEGAFLPQTYSVEPGTARAELVARLVQERQRVLDQVWQRRAPDLPLKNPADLATLASIIEQETRRAADWPRLAGMFVNRLNKNMRLQSDATVAYGLAGGAGPLGRAVTRADLDDASPYNTYRIAALPPGPISNPSRAALEAAAHPLATKELYVCPDGLGGFVFAETLAEQNRNLAKYRKLQQPKN